MRLLIGLIFTLITVSSAFCEDWDYLDAEKIVRDDLEYRQLDLTCTICSEIVDNKMYEKELAEDARYAKKYGVVNYSRRDAYIQAIKNNDRDIKGMKIDYKELSGKDFKISSCKKIDVETCSEESSKFLNKLTKEYLAEHRR